MAVSESNREAGAARAPVSIFFVTGIVSKAKSAAAESLCASGGFVLELHMRVRFIYGFAPLWRERENFSLRWATIL